MFEFVSETQITFVPHALDIWAVGAALFAASASLVVGALAYRTGRQASLSA